MKDYLQTELQARIEELKKLIEENPTNQSLIAKKERVHMFFLDMGYTWDETLVKYK